MSDDRVIDLQAYIRARDQDDDGSPLALGGTEGERRRYVLPLWRMAYLAEARWAGLVKLGSEGGAERASVVLDQGRDPARWAPEGGLPRIPAGLQPPAVELVDRGCVALSLRTAPNGDSWWAVLCERASEEMLTPAVRDDLVFLAGECSGLISLLEEDE